MNGKFLVVLGLLIYLGVIGWFCFKSAIPQKSEIEAQVPKIEAVSLDKFKDPVIDEVKSLAQFGQLPVTINKSQQGRDNPFTPY